MRAISMRVGGHGLGGEPPFAPQRLARRDQSRMESLLGGGHPPASRHRWSHPAAHFQTFNPPTMQIARRPRVCHAARHMIVTITGYKGGIGKTTTAVHLAAVLQQQAPTVLVDGDLNRSATGWARTGFLPFRVADERQAAKVGREFEHIVIDTAARPIREDLEALVTGCDHLIIPTSPDALALDALIQTLGALEALGATNYRVLLTIVPPAPSRDGYEARSSLEARDVPVFKTAIPRLAAFTKAALAGVVVSDVKGDSRVQRAWEAYANLGKELKSR